MIPARHLPSRLGADELLRRFVARGQLLDVLVSDLAAIVREGGGRYILIVGPPGYGKTHLLHLALHRLSEDAAFSASARVVLAGEESPAFALVDLWQRALTTLGRTPPADEEEALRRLDELAGRTRLVFVVEGLDRLFSAIGSSGQGRLRAALENHRAWSLVGTARQAGAMFTDRHSPFYQTFVRHLLRPFSPPEARAMLERLADADGDSVLRAALEGPGGLARVRALHHLVGGSPRAFAQLHGWLRGSTLVDPVPALLSLADDVAPVFSERVDVLADGQKPIVELLARSWRPLSVAELATACHQSHQTASSQLRRLTSLVHAVPCGRERYYELADPLLGLVRASGRPDLSNFARFLVAWYEPEPRVRWRERLPIPTPTDPRVVALLQGEAVEGEDLGATRAAVAWLRGGAPPIPEGTIDLENWLVQVAVERPPEVVARLGEQVGMGRLSLEDRVAWLHAVRTAGDPDRASTLVEEALRGVREGRELTTLRLRALLAAGRGDEALTAAERATVRWPREPVWREWAAAAANTLGLCRRAEVHASEAVRLDPEAGRAWYVLGVARATTGQFAGAAAALHRARALLPRAKEPATILLFGAFLGAGRFDEAAQLLPELSPVDRAWGRVLVAAGGGDPIAAGPLPVADPRRYHTWLHGWLSWLADQSRGNHGIAVDVLRAALPPPVDEDVRAAIAVGLGGLAAAWVPDLGHDRLAFFGLVDSVVELGAFTPILDALATLPGSPRRHARLAAPERRIVRELLARHGKEALLPAEG